jgi:protein-tyrosine phosphatase
MNRDLILQDAEDQRGCIWQGDSKSAFDCVHDVDVLVLCAEELQPRRSLFAPKSLEVVYAPNDDGDEITRAQLMIALQAAKKVAKAYLQNKCVLVTCIEGRNRSGLVVALALCLLYKLPGASAKEIVQKRRKGARALTNPAFNQFLDKVPGDEPPRRSHL